MEGNETLSSGIGRIFTGSTNGIILSMPNEGLFFSENSLYNSDLYPYNPFLISLERSRLLHSQQVLLGIHMRRIVMILSVKLEDSKIVRRKRNINRVVKILSRTTLTLATLFLFSGQVLAIPRQTFGEVQRRGSPAEFAQVVIQLPLKLRVMLRAEVFLLQLLQRVHQRLGHEPSAVGTEMSLGVRQILSGNSAHNSS